MEKETIIMFIQESIQHFSHNKFKMSRTYMVKCYCIVFAFLFIAVDEVFPPFLLHDSFDVFSIHNVNCIIDRLSIALGSKALVEI